jgi:hypothetical protein
VAGGHPHRSKRTFLGGFAQLHRFRQRGRCAARGKLTGKQAGRNAKSITLLLRTGVSVVSRQYSSAMSGIYSIQLQQLINKHRKL